MNTVISQAPNRRILYMERKNNPVTPGLEETLTSALQAADNELGQILQEVDEISTILKSSNPDQATLRVAGHPAVWSAMKQALLDRELKYLALTDDLTCLYNRRGFFAAATQQLKRARRNSENLLLLFCDVDNLKRINDSHGHQEGDMALIRVADAMEQTFRGSDIVARLGGDEFVVLAVEAGQPSEEAIFRRLEKNLKKANGPASPYSLSLSVGVARFDSKNGVTLGELMVAADRAMYEKKRKKKLA
ncbi:MAG: GGDEF domain-containing protein [Candidatus Acidiferrum sp.]